MRFLMFAALAALFTGTATFAAAADFPTRPVRIIVPFNAGGGTDLVARLMARAMSETLGKNVIIENRPGATGQIGTEAVLRSKADGYTLLFGADANFSIGPIIRKAANWDTIRDFEPISKVATIGFALAAAPNFKVANIKEMVAYAKAHPGELTMALPGVGSSHHMVLELFMMKTGAKMKFIQYGGSKPAVTDTIGGHVNMTIVGVGAALKLLKAGKLTPVATTSMARSSKLPDVPTLKEQGVDVDLEAWWGLVAPGGTPKAIVAKLEKHTMQAMKAASVTDRLNKVGIVPLGQPGSAVVDQIKADRKKFGAIADALGMRKTM